MPRKPWEPSTEEQRAVIQRIDQIAASAAEIWDAIEQAKKLGVPKDVIARHAKPVVSRATIHRRIGRDTPDSEGES